MLSYFTKSQRRVNSTNTQTVAINYVSSEHPWDGTETRKKHQTLKAARFGSTSALLVFATIVIGCTSLRAQSSLPPQSEPGKKTNIRVVQLSRECEALAEDYGDLVEQLAMVAVDYQKYFSEINDPRAKKYLSDLLDLTVKVDKGTYLNNLDLIDKDIRLLSEKLGQESSDLRGDKDTQQTYRLMRSLRRELELLTDIIDEDIRDRLGTKKQATEEIKAYLAQTREQGSEDRYNYVYTIVNVNREVAENLRKQAEEIRKQVRITAEQAKALDEIAALQDRMKTAYTFSITFDSSDFNFEWPNNVIGPEAPAPPATPDIPGDAKVVWVKPSKAPQPTHVFITEKDRSFTSQTGQVGFSKRITDSLRVPSNNLSVVVTNETGTLTVSGWNKSLVHVSFDVEVLAADEKLKEILIDEIQLELTSDDEGVYVNSHIPHISDPRQKILRSSMTVSVPMHNVLVCENSFGETSITGMRKNIKVSTNYSDLTISDITGNVEAANKMGRTVMTNIKGGIEIASSLSPVVISGCSGDIDVANSFSSVELANCNGAVAIANSGMISVKEHQGSIEIENSNGLVEIRRLQGSLEVRNAFKPIMVYDISGSTDIENANGDITIENIGGPLNATSNFGSINAKRLNGPISLSSTNGEISLLITGGLNGSSSINSDFGVVNLQLDKKSNLLVNAYTEGGIIQSTFPGIIEKDNLNSAVKIILGRGKSPLDITGNNSKIIITEPL